MLDLASALAHGFVTFGLSLSLLHQWMWRKKAATDIDSVMSGHYSYGSQGQNSDLIARSFDDVDSISPTKVNVSGIYNTSVNTPGKYQDGLQYASGSSLSSDAPKMRDDDLRHAPAPVVTTVYVSEATPFFGGTPTQTVGGWFRRLLCSWESLFLYLVLLYLIFVLVFTQVQSKPIGIIIMILFVAQRLPPLVIAFVIFCSDFALSFDAHHSKGPTIGSRIIILTAMLLYIITDLPVWLWTEALGQFGCFMKIASGVDLMYTIIIVEMLLFFVFILKEFKRNVQGCLWGATLFPAT